MTKEFDLLVFIGRFQPYHNGHHSVVEQARKLSKNVLVLVGSANKVPDGRNPFTFEQRRDMIIHSLPESFHPDCVMVAPLDDHPYDESAWVAQVQAEIKKTADVFDCKRIGLIGHAKDHSSYYLKLFPNLESVDVKGVDKDGNLLNATDVRQILFKKPIKHFENVNMFARVLDVKEMVPQGTKEVISKISGIEANRICEEIQFLNEYEKDWGKGPFVTVDAVVVQAGHVLLIERGDFPGKGQYALPGGFVEPRERLEDAVMRELNEETSIDIPPAVLKNRMTAMQHFAHPWRSNRAHIITFAFLFDLDSEIDRKAPKTIYNGNINETASKYDINPFVNMSIGLTNVKGGDDAARAFWFPISELKQELLFEDHFNILEIMLDKKAIDKL